MIKSETQLRAEGFKIVTGYRDTAVKFDVWMLEVPRLHLATIVIRDGKTGDCKTVSVAHLEEV